MGTEGIPELDATGRLLARDAEIRSVLQSLRTRADSLRQLATSRTISEACPEESLSRWRRWARGVLRFLGWRLSQPVRNRAATPDELSAAAVELKRTEDAMGRLQSALEKLPRFPSPTSPRGLQADERGYPEDWVAISLAYRRQVGFICEQCGTYAPDGHVHHVHAVSRGGGSEADNLIFLCKSCHAGEHPHMREV